MTAAEVMAELEKLGTAQTKKTFKNHGCPEPFFGVKVGDLKTIVKKVRRDTPLARELYATGNSDAMYLAGLIADGREMTADELDGWARAATWYMPCEYTVPWVAAESAHGWALGLRWIDDPEPNVQCAGWNTLAGIASLLPDEKLDVATLSALLDRVGETIHGAPNRVRYTMNGFVIGIGAYVRALTEKAKATAAKVGTVRVDMGDTECRVPAAAEYIDRTIARGQYKKKKTVKC
jgi:hypothetical protein